MLSDAQIDEMERLIYFSKPDEVMEVLSKLIPVLFAELRITRGTLNSKVNSFLGEINNAPTDEGTQGDSSEPVPEQPSYDTEDTEVSESQSIDEGSPRDTPATGRRKKGKAVQDKSGGNTRKKGRNKRKLDTRTGQAEIRRKPKDKPKDAVREPVQPDVGVEEQLPELM